MAKAVRATRSKGMLAVRCEAGCRPALITRSAATSYGIRVAARFHVRETGHPVTVTVVDETRYEPDRPDCRETTKENGG